MAEYNTRRFPKPRFTDEALTSLIYISRQLRHMVVEGEGILDAHPELTPFMTWAAQMDRPAVLQHVMRQRQKKREAARSSRENWMQRRVTGAAAACSRDEALARAAAAADPTRPRAPRMTEDRWNAIVYVGDLLTKWGTAWTENPEVFEGWRYAAMLGTYRRAARLMGGPVGSVVPPPPAAFAARPAAPAIPPAPGEQPPAQRAAPTKAMRFGFAPGDDITLEDEGDDE